MNRFAMIAGACALVFAGAAAAGSDKQQHSMKGHEDAADKSATSEPYSDRMFFTKAASGGLAEVDAGKLASTKGNSKDVRGFGQKMVTDHSKNNAELKQLAAKKNVTLPSAPDAKHQQMVAELQSLSGDAFDRKYSDDMVKGHEEMAALLEQASKQTKDADVRAFAEKTLKAVHQHHEMAEQMQKTEMAEAATD